MPLTLKRAQALVEAAVAYAEQHGYLVCVAVVDAQGHVSALVRMDGAKFLSPDIARAKAYTCAAFRLSTAVLERNNTHKALFYTGVSLVNPGQIAIGQGGLPIWLENEFLGGLGVSGLSPERDEEVAAAALQAAGYGAPDEEVAARAAAGLSPSPPSGRTS